MSPATGRSAFAYTKWSGKEMVQPVHERESAPGAALIQPLHSMASTPIPPTMNTVPPTQMRPQRGGSQIPALNPRHPIMPPDYYGFTPSSHGTATNTAIMSRNPPQQAAAPAPPPPLHPLFFGAGNESSKGSSSTTLAEYGFSFDYDNDSGGGERTSLFMPLNGGGGSSSSHHDLGELLDFSSSSYYDCAADALLLPQRPLSSTGSAATTTTATATMYSPPESTASGVTMSSMPLDFAAEEVSPSSGPASCGAAIVTGGGGGGALPEETCFSSSAVTSRDPSPLNGNSKGYVCLAYKCSAAFSRVEDLELHGRTAHQHFCLWGERCRCGGGFATREELSWHVKKEHLLVCPVLGCRESSFPSKEVVDCHLKWAHGGIAKAEAGSDGVVSHSGAAAGGGGGGTGLLRAPPVATSLSQQPQSHSQSEDMSSSTLPGPEVSSKLKRRTCESAREDRILKMQMSIGIAKKRCRDQLRMVVEKRFRRMNGESLDNNRPYFPLFLPPPPPFPLFPRCTKGKEGRK